MSDLLSLRDLIGERAGIFVREHAGLGFLEALLRARMEQLGIDSLSEYHELLNRRDNAAEAEILQLITGLSKPATSFYRTVETNRILVDTVLPHLVADGTRDQLSIWSAGCSTGEEPVSTVMALAEARWFDRVDISIKATDGNLHSIERARSGRFGGFRLRALAPELRDKYFSPVNEDWQFDPVLHQRIRWSVLNLADQAAVARMASPDVIFCQKVFIYFADEKVEQVLRWFAARMSPGGYLFADQGDHFEALMSRVDLFDRRESDGISFWQKRKAGVRRLFRRERQGPQGS